MVYDRERQLVVPAGFNDTSTDICILSMSHNCSVPL